MSASAYLDLEERRNRYIGDDLYNASRADMFLPTKNKNQTKKKKDCRLFATRVPKQVRDV